MSKLSRFDFKEVIAQLQRVKSDLPRVLANDTKIYFVGQFNKSQWNGIAWPEVERRKSGTKANKYASAARQTEHILVKSGRLRRAVVNALQIATFNLIRFNVVDVPYAQIHNEGGKAGRGGSATIPKRQYMGQTRELTEIQLKRIVSYVDKIWK